MRNILPATGKAILFAAFALTLSIAAFGQPSLRKAADFDMDGKADYMVFRPSDNTWYIQLSSGGFKFQTFGLAGDDFMTPGDYDGDGKADISVWRDSIGTWFRLNSSDNTFRGDAWGQQGDEPVARDYDNDGKTDLAVVRRSNGVMTWYVFRSSDNGFVGVPWGAAGDYVAPGDYDGDGKFDFAVQRPNGMTPGSTATFYVLKSSDFGVIAVNWGFWDDSVVPGDYDGDGRTDIAVFRDGPTLGSAMAWYILKSSDGGLLAYTWGATGIDYSAQGDYDGDGKTDIAVWRNSDGTFYIFRSQTQSTAAFRWGAPSDFPVLSYDSH